MALLENAVPVNSVGGCAIAKLDKPSVKDNFFSVLKVSFFAAVSVSQS